MRKIIILAVTALAMTSCGSMAKLINTSSYLQIINNGAIASTIFADLEVSPEKISHLYVPSKTVSNGGIENIIESAIAEALQVNGNADVLVGLQKQIKYNEDGIIESVVVTGYPARYTNFRNAPDSYYTSEAYLSQQVENESSGKFSVFGK